MKYFTAKTYEDYEIVKTKEENNKMYAIIKMWCPRCNGHGRLCEYGHVDSGVCFKCGGQGFSFKQVRAYTAKERKKLDERNAKSTETKEAKKIAAAADTFAKNCKKYGFDAEQKCTYIVIGDSYSIKDSLKEAGFKYDAALGWHSPVQVELPQDLILHKIDFDEIATVNKYGEINYKNNTVNYIKEIKAEYVRQNSKSEYLAAGIGDKIKDITVEVKKISGFSGKYGWTNIYTFVYNDCELVWFTSTDKEIEEGDIIQLTGTIKEFKEYNGIKQTVLTRCRI